MEHPSAAFIIGCHRSGTTLVRYLLDAHSNVSCPPESKFIAGLEAFLHYPQALRGLSSLGISAPGVVSRLRVFVESVFREYAASQGKSRWIDKTPNYYRLWPLLEALFAEDVVYLVIRRHPMDNVQSLCRMFCNDVRLIEDPDVAAVLGRGGEGRRLFANYWVEVNQSLNDLVSVAKNRVVTLKYEDLVLSPVSALTRMCAAVNEDYEPEMLARAFTMHHSDGYADPRARMSRGIYTSSIGKWRSWSRAEIEDVWAVVEGTAVVLGYAL
jgi:protein-tyrosine sulfotransferase